MCELRRRATTFASARIKQQSTQYDVTPDRSRVYFRFSAGCTSRRATEVENRAAPLSGS